MLDKKIFKQITVFYNELLYDIHGLIHYIHCFGFIFVMKSRQQSFHSLWPLL